MTSPLRFDTDFDATPGAPIAVTEAITRVTAPNSSPYTFTGTNSFIVGTDMVAIVDPGPDDPSHLDALIKAIAGRVVVAIILTHTHKDHSMLAPNLAVATGAPIWFEGPHRLSHPDMPFETNPLKESCDWDLQPHRRLVDGEMLEIGRTRMRVIATPGHCANHLAFGIVDTPYVLTGDHVMGWNSTLVSVPDGSMADYLAALDKLSAMAWSHYLPAHGGPIADGPIHAKHLKAHRLRRNRQILDLLAAQGRALTDLLGAIYPELPATHHKAALMTLEAHLAYLQDQQLVDVHREPNETLYMLRG